jgi:hypothetical protein
MTITAPAVGSQLATDQIAGTHFPLSKLVYGEEDAATMVSPEHPFPTTDALVLAAIQALLLGSGSLPAGAATSAKQDAASTLLTAIATALAGTLAVSANALPLPAGAATQATLASLLAKTIAAPATEAKQDASNTSLAAIVTALAATLNVLPLIKPWTAWTAGTANDMRNYAGVEIQVTATAAATFARSADDATYVPISASVAGAASASPLAPGFYSLKGGGFLKWAGTGTILIRGYN